MLMTKIYQQEEKKVIELVGNAMQILDYGCGLGRYLSLFLKMGRSITGVDINPEIVNLHQNECRNVCLPNDFKTTKECFDCIILSHIIEHIYPNDLITLIDRLVPNAFTACNTVIQ